MTLRAMRRHDSSLGVYWGVTPQTRARPALRRGGFTTV